ncbi:hypothetical protein C8J45_1052 [Sphingomonas sp. PP-CE-3G-477]|uniref:hypothetical protein n=1 Tax=Sphingomonas sp. PP-CE-3G-477 TaxID=2135660 RepID=UPI000D3495AE|nr:hypothetical protein [Sphingomonas sp. PP-CE-3G-477]PTQ63431.1 hypothetical protein C8J45_1052 [Sphingomonas sp. PP-CE-3G-477]
MIAEGTIDWGGRLPQGQVHGKPLHEVTSDIHEWIRQVRGGIMAGAFAVERMLSASIIHYFLGGRMRDLEVQDAFDEGILQRLTFERRISLALIVAAKFFDPVAFKDFEGKLTSLRTLRNAMAHNPFWLHPEFDDEGTLINIVPVIKRGKSVVSLTTPFIEEQNAEIKCTIDLAQELVVAVVASIQGEFVAKLLPRDSTT